MVVTRLSRSSTTTCPVQRWTTSPVAIRKGRSSSRTTPSESRRLAGSHVYRAPVSTIRFLRSRRPFMPWKVTSAYTCPISFASAMAIIRLRGPPLQVRFGGLVRTPTAPVRSGLDLLHDQARPGHRGDPELVVLPEVHVAEHVAREIDAQSAPSQGAHGRGVRAIRAVLLDEPADDPRALPVVDRLPAAVAAEPGEVSDDDALAGRGHLRLKVVYPQERPLLAVGASWLLHGLEDTEGLCLLQSLPKLRFPLRADHGDRGVRSTATLPLHAAAKPRWSGSHLTLPPEDGLRDVRRRLQNAVGTKTHRRPSCSSISNN